MKGPLYCHCCCVGEKAMLCVKAFSYDIPAVSASLAGSAALVHWSSSSKMALPTWLQCLIRRRELPMQCRVGAMVPQCAQRPLP